MQKKEHTAFVFAHVALFIVFVWFGSLKLFGLSPAGPLVDSLFQETIGAVFPFITANAFMIIFGAYEVLIGILFVVPRMEKLATILLLPHMITTIMPLFVLPEMTWDGFLTPSLEGQYIIKNVIILALVAMVFVELKRARKKLVGVR